MLALMSLRRTVSYKLMSTERGLGKNYRKNETETRYWQKTKLVKLAAHGQTPCEREHLARVPLSILTPTAVPTARTGVSAP